MSFWQARTRIDAADRLFSKFIRWRDGNRCVYCGADGRIAQIENSHFFGRAKESTRFDPENCDALCRTCHQRWEDQKGMAYRKEGQKITAVGMVDTFVYVPAAYRAWKIHQLGQARFDALEVRAHTPMKKDRKMAMLRIRAMMAAMNTISEFPVIGSKA